MKKLLLIIICFAVVFGFIAYADKKINEIYGLDNPETLKNIFNFQIR